MQQDFYKPDERVILKLFQFHDCPPAPDKIQSRDDIDSFINHKDCETFKELIKLHPPQTDGNQFRYSRENMWL